MKRVLFLSAHPDDFETGAGGFFSKMSGSIKAFNLVFSECSEQKGNETIVQEFHKAMEMLGLTEGDYELLSFPNTKLPENAAGIREAMERVAEEFNPDTVFVHDIDNLHQDHKCIAEQALRVFKTQSVLFFQDLKSTPHFTPNIFVSISKENLDRKIKSLECYQTQFRRYYHDMEFVRSLARVWGKRINAEFAEAFRSHQLSI